ncbi:hypothetical protein J7J47_11915 [Halomonas sp. ISL-60]|uniref:hypothetical protein n=1 Tax=Halomonas sp. ISL-56 TaxID=2819149 RepID=UPI001BE67266|nr:hypothetical protein [Halomonas sp. ISL-56]MBT2772929.1 hypothetical protein [Halomonas sp. ISL-60]MBT2799976.1 hypothetical protein [Halomonas sp. ISL-56]
MAKRHDWELIEREYRTGRFSLTQLEKRHGVHRSNISRRAKKDHWEKDLTDRVRERTQQKITKASLSPEAQAAFDNDDEQIVEYAANENAAVVKGHRKNLERWRGIAERYAEMLEQQLDKGKIKVQVLDVVMEIDIPLEYVGKCMGHGTQALDRVIKLERQNYGLDANDKDEGVKTFEELMAEVAPSDSAAE